MFIPAPGDGLPFRSQGRDGGFKPLAAQLESSEIVAASIVVAA